MVEAWRAEVERVRVRIRVAQEAVARMVAVQAVELMVGATLVLVATV